MTDRDLLAELHDEQCAHGSTLREVDRLREALRAAESTFTRLGMPVYADACRVALGEGIGPRWIYSPS